MNKIECKLCNKEFKNLKGLAIHVNQSHSEIGIKQYYDLFMKKGNEEICNHPNCNKNNRFYGIRGYAKHCSSKCLNSNPEMVEKNRKRMTDKYKDPNEKLKTGISVKKAFDEDPTICKRIQKSIKKFYNDNPDERIKTGERSKKMWKDPKIRNTMTEKIKEVCRTESHREKQRKIMKEISKDEEWRKRVSDGTKKGQLKNPNFKKSRREYMKDGGAAHCNSFIKNPSKPQVILFNLIQEVAPYPVLNYPCIFTNRSIDIAIPSLSIAIEYDGSYWHQNEEDDNIRQESLEKNGWKFIRYKNKIPTKEELIKDINLTFDMGIL